MRRGKSWRGFIQRAGTDVDGLIEHVALKVCELTQQHAGLGGGTRAELRDRDMADQKQTEAQAPYFCEDRPLGAREVVLRQLGDLLEELRAALIVEEPW